MKFIRNFLEVLLILLMASTVWAAGTVVIQSDKIVGGTREITYLVTFGADASSPAATALNSILKSVGTASLPVGGWWLFKANAYFGATGPTDNTDFYIYRDTGTNKDDIMGNNGLNAIDNATNNTNIYPATSTQPLFGDELLVVSGNAVNNAIVQIVLELYR